MAQIRKVRPKTLYIIADGPRAGRPLEAEQCAETRRVVEAMVDWPCEVKKNYSETNLGCGTRIPTGLDWVFEQEESAIILEGDIVADPSFFHFCAEMLERYRHDKTIRHIGGYNRFNHHPAEGSYFYSRYCDIWGWATWRSAWQKFRELDHAEWERIKRENLFAPKCASQKEASMRTYVLDDIFSGRLDAWGMRWQATRIMNGWKAVVPAKNLVKNIGFGPSARHTVNPFNRNQLMRIHALAAPYAAPPSRKPDKEYETIYHDRMFSPVQFEKARTRLLKLLFGKS